MDFDHGLARVRQQLSRHRIPKRLKTDAGRRDVVLATQVVLILHDRWEAARHPDPEDLVFCEPDGTGLAYHNVATAFRAAVSNARITGQGSVSLHSLRHGFASLLIAAGLNVAFVSRQLGHTKPTTTLGVYTHLFAHAEHAQTARTALEANYLTVTETRATQPRIGAAMATTMETDVGPPPSEPRAQPHAAECQD